MEEKPYLKKNYCRDLMYDCKYFYDDQCPCPDTPCSECKLLTYKCSDCLYYAKCDLHP